MFAPLRKRGVGSAGALPTLAEVIDAPGVADDRFVVRSCFTKDNRATHQWGGMRERPLWLGAEPKP